MRIIDKEKLGEVSETKITRFTVEAPAIAENAKPGQFLIVMVKEEGERIPLTIVDSDKSKGTITLIVQEVGLTTKILGNLAVGEKFFALVGPLGSPAKIKNYGKVVLVGGGVGIAEIYPIAKALRKAGNQIVVILGARTKDLLILEKELKDLSDGFHITTDDGTKGKKGFTTEILTNLLSKEKYGLVYAVGPIPMMKNVSLIAKTVGAEILVSLNSLMVDASGMCGSCRVLINGEAKFACVDGPEFNGNLVDWDGLEKRNRIYQKKEEHICKLNKL